MARSPKPPSTADRSVQPEEAQRGYRRRTRSLADSSQGLIVQILKSAGLPFPELMFKWGDIVGPRLGRVMIPVRYRPGTQGEGGTLVVEAPHSAMLELQHQSDILIARINAALGRPAIAKLKVERSVYRRAAQPAALPRPRPLTPVETETVDTLAQPIAEPELKAALKALAGQVLRKGKPARPAG